MNKLISEKDEQTLKELVSWWRTRQGRGNALDVDEDLESHMAPEKYIALGPIPAREGMRPGVAECDIFEQIDGELKQVTGFTLAVYNPSDSEIDDSTFVSVARDKYGTWWVDQGGGGGGAVDVCGSHDDPQAGTGTGTGTGTGADGGCKPDTTLYSLIPNVRIFKFHKQQFIVTEIRHLDCGASGTGSGTSEHGVFLQLGGMDVDIEYVRHVFWCTELCDLRELHGVLCYRGGLLMDHYFVLDEPQDCAP